MLSLHENESILLRRQYRCFLLIQRVFTVITFSVYQASVFLGPIHLHMRGILAFTRSNSYITLDILKLRTWPLQSEGCTGNTEVTFEYYQS